MYFNINVCLYLAIFYFSQTQKYVFNIVNWPTTPVWPRAVGHANRLITYVKLFFIPIMEYVFGTHYSFLKYISNFKNILTSKLDWFEKLVYIENIHLGTHVNRFSSSHSSYDKRSYT